MVLQGFTLTRVFVLNGISIACSDNILSMLFSHFTHPNLSLLKAYMQVTASVLPFLKLRDRNTGPWLCGFRVCISGNSTM